MQYVAFLRGMNLGGRRITNDELCDCFRQLALENVWAFLASGNVVFESGPVAQAPLARRIQAGLKESLGYDVVTFLRSAAEVTALADTTPFAEPHGVAGGKLQVSLLQKKPTTVQGKKALSLATDNDQLALIGRELYWLPKGKLTDSDLDVSGIEKALGSTTTRTFRTIQRLAAKLTDS